MNEKIGGVEGTKFTDEFTQLERVLLFVLLPILFWLFIFVDDFHLNRGPILPMNW